MYFKPAFLLSSLSLPFAHSSILQDRQTSCPSVWTSISQDLTGQFASGKGCVDVARAAIRAAFHDCFPGAGGCDGSLLLSGELNNPVNSGILDLGNLLISMVKKYGVGNADLVQFAAAHAVKTCTDGPLVKVQIGRTDSSTAPPLSELPEATDSADHLLTVFSQKSFSAVDLAALIGAHTCANQFTTNTSKAGASLDTTPGTWDITFYQQTLDGSAPFSFQSDISIMNHPQTAPSFQLFANNVTAWEEAFVPAMEKMAVLGVMATGLIDCTSALPQ